VKVARNWHKVNKPASINQAKPARRWHENQDLWRVVFVGGTWFSRSPRSDGVWAEGGDPKCSYAARRHRRRVPRWAQWSRWRGAKPTCVRVFRAKCRYSSVYSALATIPPKTTNEWAGQEVPCKSILQCQALYWVRTATRLAITFVPPPLTRHQPALLPQHQPSPAISNRFAAIALGGVWGVLTEIGLECLTGAINSTLRTET
jgi:hypothetical protein